MNREWELFIDIPYGDGSGNGDGCGYGDGNGAGDERGHGDGDGAGDGCGYVNGDGNGNGNDDGKQVLPVRLQ